MSRATVTREDSSMSSEQEPVQFSIRSPAYIKDPYSFYRILRERDPVHLSKDGYWFLTKYEDISTALRDPRLRNSPAPFSLLNRRNAGKYIAADVANNLIAFLDPPEHTIPRKIISTTFQEFILKQEVQKLEAACRACLDKIAEREEIEFVADFATPYSVRCISDLFGIGAEVSDKLPYWADMIFHLFHSFPNRDVFLHVNEAIGEFRGFMCSLMKDRKNTPRDDLATRLICARNNDSRINEEQIIDNAMLICADAIGNVHNGLTNAVLTLLSNEAQRRELRDNPRLISAAVDECLRFESPAQYQGRIAGEDIEIRGKKIKKNSVVLLALGAANRDPDLFEEPDTFNILRQKTTHLAFGLGPHRCIGIGLVRAAFECALKQLFQGVIELRLMTQEINWISRAGHRWPHSLKLRVDRAVCA
jgi:cytochrome P450